MSTPPPRRPRPNHLQPLQLEIPRTWTPEQALAVFELIDDLRDKICAIYDAQLQECLREQCADRSTDGSNDPRHERPF